MSFDRTKLINAIDKLQKYYGISGIDELLKTIALQSVVAEPVSNDTTRRQRPVDQANPEEFEILKTMFHDKTSLFSTESALFAFSEIFNRAGQNGGSAANLITKFNNTFQIFHENTTRGADVFVETDGTNQQKIFKGTNRNYDPISEIIKEQTGPNQEKFINQGSPTKTSPNVAVYLCNSHRLNFNQFYGDLLTLWLNGIPTHEIAKSMPFFDIQFNTPRAPVDNQNKLSGLGLNKFIFGAKTVNGKNDPFYITTAANASTIETVGRQGASNAATPQTQSPANPSTVAGMEIFTSPTSLIAPDTLTSGEHSAAVLDPMQPFLSIEDVAISVAPSTGLMSFKTATITMRLHDRSRLADIAEFVRPEYYGLNEVILEYGWIHPDAEMLGNAEDNPYADFINNLRVKEKYGIVNHSFNFGDSGGIKITLSLAMRGSQDMIRENIASNQDSLQNPMAEIEVLRGAIEAIKSRFPDGRVQGREIRGFDIINNLSDSTFNFTLGRQFLTDLRKLQTSISHVPQLAELSTAISRLVSENGNSGEIRNIQRTILQDIQLKVSNLLGGTKDPMLMQVNDSLQVIAASQQESGTFAQFPTNDRNVSTEINNTLNSFGVANINTLPQGQFSFSKLMLEFVARPLAATRKYDDIQIMFYPFNVYAGRANRLNIGNFGIDARLFVMKYMEWRLGRLNQSLNVNLHEFMRFIIDQIVSDPASVAYGLYSPNNSRTADGGVNRGFKYFSENGSIQTRLDPGSSRQGQQETDGGAYLQQINRQLDGVTPNAEFRPPQIEFFIEALPMKIKSGSSETVDNSKTVLRIHVYDKTATSLESLSQLEMASRDLALQNIGTAWTKAQSSIRNIGVQDPNADAAQRATIPTDDDANTIILSIKEMLQQTINLAIKDGLIRPVNQNPAVPSSANSDSSQSNQTTRYIFQSNPETLREFFRKNSPHMIYGSSGTTVKNATFSSLQDSALSTVNMLRSTQRAELQSNGENPGGLPMQVSPGQCELTILGNPLVFYAQSLFNDFQTGTTIDNFYAITSITHNMSPGKFETKLGMTPVDGYGKYINIANVLNNYTSEVERLSQQATSQLQDLRVANRTTGRRSNR